MNKLSKISKILIIDQAIGQVIHIFLDTFLAAYFYKITEQNIFYLSVYNIVAWFFATIGAFFVADIIKRKNKVKLYQFGIFVKSCYIFMIILLGEKIVDYVYVIGIMYGIATATTGFPLNMIESENIKNGERSKYLGFLSASKEITKVIVPIILGAYITFRSYQIAAILIFIFSILKLINSFAIENKNVQTEKINLRDFYLILKKDATLKKLYLIEFFKGINKDGVMSLVVSLLIIYQTKNELELGGWTSLFSIFTIIAMYLFGKYYKKSHKRKILNISMFFLILSFGAVLYKINFVTVIIYDITYHIFINIISNITKENLFNYSNVEPFKTSFNTEYFIFRELFLNIGRMTGYAALLVLVGITQNLELLNVLFVVIVISIILMIAMSKSLDYSENVR